jgi:hypothetical protein
MVVADDLLVSWIDVLPLVAFSLIIVGGFVGSRGSSHFLFVWLCPLERLDIFPSHKMETNSFRPFTPYNPYSGGHQRNTITLRSSKKTGQVPFDHEIKTYLHD